jgi:hypothetical protein
MNSNVNSWLSTTTGTVSQDCAIPVAIGPILLIPPLEPSHLHRATSVKCHEYIRLPIILKSFEVDLGKMRAIVPA